MSPPPQQRRTQCDLWNKIKLSATLVAMKSRVSVNSALYMVLFTLLAVILIGTLVVFATRNANPGKNLRQSDPVPQTLAEGFSSFTEIGQIRAATAVSSTDGEGQATVIVQPWFSYENNDTAFHEELFGKRRKIRSIITDYFSTHTYQQLRKNGEGIVKAEILSAVNKELVMGKISAIYFEEYLFLE